MKCGPFKKCQNNSTLNELFIRGFQRDYSRSFLALYLIVLQIFGGNTNQNTLLNKRYMSLYTRICVVTVTIDWLGKSQNGIELQQTHYDITLKRYVSV